MKLYEFTVTDEYNLRKSKILEIAEISAAEEAPHREWGEYKVIECHPLERLTTGEIRYYFAVEGEYADSEDVEDNNTQTQPSNRNTRSSASAPEL